MKNRFKIFISLALCLIISFSFVSIPFASYLTKAESNADSRGGVVEDGVAVKYFNLASLFNLWVSYDDECMGTVGIPQYYVENGVVSDFSNIPLLYTSSYAETADDSELRSVFSLSLESEPFLEPNMITYIYGLGIYGGRTLRGNALRTNLSVFGDYFFTESLYEHYFVSENKSSNFYVHFSNNWNIKAFYISAIFYGINDMGLLVPVEYTYTITQPGSAGEHPDEYEIPSFGILPSLQWLRSHNCVIGADKYIYMRNLTISPTWDADISSDSDITYHGSIDVIFDYTPLISYNSWTELQSAGMVYCSTGVITNITDTNSMFWSSVEGFFSIELFEGFKIYHTIIILVGLVVFGVVLKVLLGG